MARAKSHYQCTECGGNAPKWSGQCPHCERWNTMIETVGEPSAPGRQRGPANAQPVRRLDDIPPEAVVRLATGSEEFDRVLGGGLVAGSVVLIGGDPGIGKSTLLLQTLAHLSAGQRALYVSGEESIGQIALRAHRLGLGELGLPVLAEVELEPICAEIERSRPAVVVIDSIQTMCSTQLQSAPGSVAQVRECAARLTWLAKQTGIALVMIGHVTKDGTLAGPRVLEHIVDTVLYFEGEQHSTYRMIRAFKNRFGAVNELGVFAMTDRGLRAVSNPSAIFLSQRDRRVPGSCVLVSLEGSRPLLVEVQALVDTAHIPNPRRVSVGLEGNRLAMLLAVLHRHAGIACYDQDVFVNVVGGVRISEPAADLAVLLAIVSSLRNRALPSNLAVFGEIGLAGEIRPAPRGQERLREAGKLGFPRVLIPQANAPRKPIEGVEPVALDAIDQALAAAWN